MTLDITSNADEVAATLSGALVDAATERAHQTAADEALALVVPRTPRRSGRLVAGLSRVVAGPGWAVVDPVPYASVVDARTGFASQTLIANQTRIVDIYDRALQTEFDTL